MIGDKILHRIFGEEFAKLRTKLRGECFIVRQNERRLVHVGDDVRHGERLSRAGDAEQYLFPVAAQHALCQLFDRLRLVAGRLLCGMQYKLIHRHLSYRTYVQYTTSHFNCK